MIGFGHWDYAESFTGKEAAHLIAGIDPSLSNAETEYKVRPIIIRMKKAYYQFARELASSIKGSGAYAEGNEDYFFAINPFKNRTSSGSALWSVEIENLLANYNTGYLSAGFPDDYQFCESDRNTVTIEQVKQYDEKRLAEENSDSNARWLDVEIELSGPIFEWAYEYVHEFDDQKFSRIELHRWIRDNGLRSEYQFEIIKPKLDIGRETDSQQGVSPKSEAAFLNIIGALCELYWDATHGTEEYSQSKLLQVLAKYEGFPGLSERNLKEKLTKAMRAIRS